MELMRNWRLTAFRRQQLFVLMATVLLGNCGPDSENSVETPPVTNVPAREVATRLPVLTIQTANAVAITSKETYVAASYALTDTTGVRLHEGALEIRGRGFSTWTMPKKPYRLKLGASTALLAMPANRHWVLLANYSDKTLMRNDIAFEFSRLLGMEYSPRARYVDVELNGAYQGLYQLVEHVRIASERVNIPELKSSDTSATSISGGYLIEVDERWGEDFCFQSGATPMVFCLSNPETLNDPAWAKQKAYIQDYMRQVDESIFSPQFTNPNTGYAAYIDVESAISYYILNELFRNVDGNLRLSTYLYKKRGGLLTFGPVWDFDLAIGNANYLNADRVEGWYIRTAPWFDRLFQDPAFANRVKQRWQRLVSDGTLNKLDEYILYRRSWLSTVQERNFDRWPILHIWVWPNRVVTGSYEGEVFALRDWLGRRRIWLESQFH
jgi:hypothetical protein